MEHSLKTAGGRNMWLWFIAAFAAFFVKGLCGFANTLVFTSIMAFGTANRLISPVELLIGFPANFVLAWRGRKRLDRKLVLLCALFMVLGGIPGALFLKTADVSAVRIFFGFVVLFTAGQILFRKEQTPRSGSGLPVLLIGLFSGFLSGMFGVGALMAACIERMSEDMESFKANASAVFFLENILRIPLYAATGILTMDSLKLAALILPACLLGLYGGIYISSLLKENVSRKIVIVPLIVSGISMIIMNL